MVSLLKWLSPSNDWETRRQVMVDHQIVRRGIKDQRVINAMRRVPRHEFVEPEYAAYAYDDRPLSIGLGQTISQPYIVALMLEMLELTGTERVLEIGTGSGYNTALLRELANEVHTVEIHQELSRQAQQTIARLNYQNIYFKVSDGHRGWPEAACFDRIIAAACAKSVPKALVDQLSINGKMILPVGAENQQRLMSIFKGQHGISQQWGEAVVFVPMTGQGSDAL